jgi:hypothetical protein
VSENLDQAINRIKEEERLYKEDKRGKLTIKHIDTANATVKMIMQAPIHDLIKKIMILRVGSPVMKQKPMSHLSIALQLGMREGEVAKLEREGVQIVTEFMEKVCLQDSVEKFNKEGNQNDVKNILA